MISLAPPFAPMARYDQWLTWIARPHPLKPGKFKKLPCDPRTGRVCNAHDPARWTTAAVACGAADFDPSKGGVAFVLTKDDPFFFLDIDNCRLQDGTWSALAQQLCTLFAGAAVEVSHSGKGLHIMGSYSSPLPPHGTKNTALGLEFYTSGRFIALTCLYARGLSSFDATAH